MQVTRNVHPFPGKFARAARLRYTQRAAAVTPRANPSYVTGETRIEAAYAEEPVKRYDRIREPSWPAKMHSATAAV